MDVMGTLPSIPCKWTTVITSLSSSDNSEATVSYEAAEVTVSMVVEENESSIIG